jgi:hypothetical protein
MQFCILYREDQFFMFVIKSDHIGHYFLLASQFI